MKFVNMKNNINGFTLVELLIALFVGSLAMASIYNVFMSQQRSYYAQDQVARMHQNLRAGLDFLVSELMVAGYNDPANDANARITAATNNTITFTVDRNEDGDLLDADEIIAYDLFVAADGIQKLGRASGAGPRQAVAENIEQIEFFYTTNTGAQTLAPANLNNIRSVQVSILSRANEVDPAFTEAVTYTSASGVNWAYAADNFRRRLLITTVKFRNLGL